MVIWHMALKVPESTVTKVKPRLLTRKASGPAVIKTLRLRQFRVVAAATATGGLGHALLGWTLWPIEFPNIFRL